LGGIYSSTNGGSTWTLTTAPANFQSWVSVASSTNGVNLVATGGYAPTSTHVIYTSPDSGNTWNPATIPNLRWYSVASSADGTKLVAMANTTNVIYTSSDSGITWVPNPIANATWYSVASSYDGTRLAALSYDGLTYTSTNSGTSWVSNNVASSSCYSISSSADGTKLAVASYPAIYTSVNGGQTWISNNLAANYWTCVTSSLDGNSLAAVSGLITGYGSGNICVAQPSPPSISLRLSGTNIIVSWPSSSSGFHVQQNLTLNGGAWSDLTNSPTVTNNLNQVTIRITNSPTFYRLQNL